MTNHPDGRMHRFENLAWYDFICPFCYIGQRRSQILENAGLTIVELPFQSHPEIPEGGIAAGPRGGPMYEFLAGEAVAAELPLRWPDRLPNTRLALAAAEWTRQHEVNSFPKLHENLFEAHFVAGEDLGDPAIIDGHMRLLGLDPALFWAAVADGTAEKAVAEAEAIGRSLGVRGTPAWFVGGRLIMGLRPAADFEQLAGAQQRNA